MHTGAEKPALQGEKIHRLALNQGSEPTGRKLPSSALRLGRWVFAPDSILPDMNACRILMHSCRESIYFGLFQLKKVCEPRSLILSCRYINPFTVSWHCYLNWDQSPYCYWRVEDRVPRLLRLMCYYIVRVTCRAVRTQPRRSRVSISRHEKRMQ